MMNASRPLVIVLSVIYNPTSIVKDVGTIDPRYEVFRDVVYELRRLGHRVLTLAADNGKRDWPEIRELYDEDGSYDPEKHGRPDCAIMWWAYRGPHAPPVGVPTVYYENGFAKGDVVVDPGGLLGDSFYKNSLNDLVQEGVDMDRCDAFVEERLSGGSWSKRPQQRQRHEEDEGYVFVPTQKLADLSIEKFSNTSMVELLRKTARFCGSRGLRLVVKIHPHVKESEQQRQAGVVYHYLRRKFTPNVTISNASIGDLVRRARFTACLNGGTIVDNAYTQTPVLSTASSMFMHTDAVYYEPDVKKGLEEMLELTGGANGGWPESRRERQRQLVCWLDKNSLNSRKSGLLNVETIQRHFDAKYPGQFLFFR